MLEKTPRSFHAISDLTYSMWTIPVPPHRVLMIEFAGVVANNKPTNDEAFMQATIAGAFHCWPSQALILDLRRLSYSWGDRMQSVLLVGHNSQLPACDSELPELLFGEIARLPPFRTCVIVSDTCRAGLTSLVRDEMSMDPAKWLFDSLEAVICSVEAGFSG